MDRNKVCTKLDLKFMFEEKRKVQIMLPLVVRSCVNPVLNSLDLSCAGGSGGGSGGCGAEEQKGSSTPPTQTG
ncbi:hypothetical protein E4U43_005813 [Claviceps pusilla]|uniref:Uncharacterized protein n=1 Tax=Claviceps pusilla TaxID=123648 RepID=A0A9P7N4E5_9HYPO|nr:hypothetical protein E4U43_005813 [Claviceps pusilla]